MLIAIALHFLLNVIEPRILLTFTPSSLTTLRDPVARSTIVAMLSKGFLWTCMNFIGTSTTRWISSRTSRLPSWLKAKAVFPPCLSPITFKKKQICKEGTRQEKRKDEGQTDRSKLSNGPC